MKMDLILSQNKIEASVISYSNLQVELKDRYNNIVFNDNSTNTTLQISNKYKAIIVPDKYSSKVSE
jgi:quinolinate synthase